MTIPNKIHFIFGLRPDFGGKPFSYVHYLAVATALKVNRPDQLYLHFQFEPDTYWWKKACELATPRRLTAAVSVHGTPMDEHAHRTDLARLEILLSEGGIYLDLDVICVNPFTPLLAHRTVMGREAGSGLCNAVILSEPNAEFLLRWKESFVEFDPSRYGWHAVVVPGLIAGKSPELLHIEPESSFFFPMPRDPEHALWASTWKRYLRVLPREAAFRLAVIGRNALTRSGPCHPFPSELHWFQSRKKLFRKLTGSYSIHLWERMWWAPYLSRLTPESLLRDDDNFSCLLRQVLGDGPLLRGG